MAPSRGPTALARNLHTTLGNHKGPVHVARYAKGTAKYVMTGGQDRTVRLWNPTLGTEIKSYSAHGYEVLSLDISHDNSKFVSSGGDRQVFVWDVMTGKTIRRIPGHMGRINVVELNTDASVVASGSFDSTVRLWDLKATNRQAIQVLEDAHDAIQTLHVGNGYIMTGSVDGHVRTYDLRMGELRTDYIGFPVTSIVPSQDDQTYLVTTLDSHVRLMDATTGKMLNDFTGQTVTTYRCRSCFGHGEASIMCGDEKGMLWAWDLLDASVLSPNPPPVIHDKVITWVEHHPTEDGELITASADGTVKVWKNTPQ
ncbi:WD repeat domain-containing protein MORG1 [Abortiporus biennis]